MTSQTQPQPILNNVKNRFLPIPEAVLKGLEPEPKINDFDIQKELGNGSFGRVYLVTHKKTKVQYAIKAIDKQNKTNIEEKPYFRREIEIMYKIHHPNVVKLFGHFEDDHYCYFIMEYISKGNIYQLIPKDRHRRLSTQVVASLMKDVISAVYFLHHMNPPIIHRDIKPENVLLAEGLVAKLTDFGWSNYMEGAEKRMTVCGTPIYLAPEIINETGHDEKVDIWCIGVLLFELCSGTVPFQGNDLESLKQNIRHMKIMWPRDINMDAKNLISQILKYEASQRIGLIEILNHPFFTKFYPNAAQNLIKPDDNLVYVPYIVSKDNPKNYNPIHINSNNNSSENLNNINNNNNNINVIKKEKKICVVPKKKHGKNRYDRDISPIPISRLHLDKLNKNINNEDNNNNNDNNNNINTNISYDKFMIIKKKYEDLKKEYEHLNSNEKIMDIQKELTETKLKLREKEQKIVNLIKLNKAKSGEIDDNNIIEENNKLKEENEKLKKLIEDKKNNNNTFNNNNNDFDKENLNKIIENFKNNLNDDQIKEFNIILSEKDKEIENVKESEKILREKEKEKYSKVVKKYDKTLSYSEKENKELKIKIKELENKLKNINNS